MFDIDIQSITSNIDIVKKKFGALKSAPVRRPEWRRGPAPGRGDRAPFLSEGFIRETKVEGRKRSYLITPQGRERLAGEVRRLERQTEDYRKFGESRPCSRAGRSGSRRMSG